MYANNGDTKMYSSSHKALPILKLIKIHKKVQNYSICIAGLLSKDDLPLPYKQLIALPPESAPAKGTNDIIHSHSNLLYVH